MKQAPWCVAEGEISGVATAAHGYAVIGRIVWLFHMRAQKAHHDTNSAVVAYIGPRTMDDQAVVQADLASA